MTTSEDPSPNGVGVGNPEPAPQSRRFVSGLRARANTLTAPQRRLVEIGMLLVVTVFLLWYSRRMWFFSDDWAFLLGRREALHTRGFAEFFFAPHNEHFLGGLAVVYAVLLPAFGMNSAFPFMVVLLIGHALVAWMVGRLAVRAGASWGWSLFAMLWLGILGAGNENLIWPVEIGYVWGTVAALVGLMLISGHRSTRRDVTTSVVFLLGLTMGPASLVVMALLALWLVGTKQWRRAVTIAVVPGAFYVWWHFAYGRRFHAPWGHPKAPMAPYFVRGVTNALDKMVVLSGVGAVLWLGALVLLARTATAPIVRRTIVLCTAAFLGYFAVGSYTRAGLGPEQATSPRYLYVGAVFVLPVLVAGACIAVRRYPYTRWIVAGLALLALVGNLGFLAEARNARRDTLANVRPQIEMAAMHARSTIVDPNFQPSPEYNPDITMGRLSEIQNSGLWSPQPVLAVDDWLAGSLEYGVVVREDGPTPASTQVGLVLTASSGSVGAERDGCVDVLVSDAEGADLEFAADAPGGFVTLTGDGAVTASAEVTAPDGDGSSPRSLASLASAPIWVGMDPVYGAPHLLLAGTGAAHVCGVRRAA